MKIFCFTFVLILASIFASAQTKKIRGTIEGSEGNPLIGVTIQVKGSSTAVASNKDGHYSIEMPSNYQTLVFSSIGYVEQSIIVGDRTIVNVEMQLSTTSMSDVVVVGYGTAKKSTLTGAIVSTKGSEILKAPVTNVSNALVGLLPGLSAVQSTSEPGFDNSTIYIRGVNTFGNNSPLIVVDGVPGRSLSRIDPYSIESITVLKDASAAIYGSEAANGVIIITTKRGIPGRPKATISFNQGFTQPSRLPKMDNSAEYATQLNELNLYAGQPNRYSEEDIQKMDGSEPWVFPNTDWFKEVLKPWSNQNNLNATLSGGSDKLQYFISLGSQFQDAFYKKSVSNYKQYNFRSNIDAHLSDNVSVEFDVSGRLENRNQPTMGSGNIFRQTYHASPLKPAYWPDGSSGPDIDGGINPAVIATNAAGTSDDKQYYLSSNLKLNIKIPWVKGLSVSGLASFDKSFQYRKNWQTPWTIHSWDGVTYDANNNPVLAAAQVGFVSPQLTVYAQDNSHTLLNGILNYGNTFGKHSINFLAGTESILGQGNNFNAFRKYFVSTAIPELFAGGDAEKSNTGSAFEQARLNYFGRINYNYDEKYLFEFVWRYDGSYIFPKKGRYGFFPGFSAGWILSKENFWKKSLSFINNFKLRASWGQTGNDLIDEWQYLSTYASSGIYVLGLNQEEKMLYEARTPNPDVTWEVANQADIGVDAAFLNNKITLSFDYFNNKRTGILWYRNASVPQTTGLTLPRENIGKVENKGFEFTIGYHNVERNFKYNISLNGGYAKNKVIFWDEAPGVPKWQTTTGKPVASSTSAQADLYYISLGIFKDQHAVDDYPHWGGARPGDIIYKDVNDDGKIDQNDMVRNDRSNVPRFTGALNLNLQYKRFDLSVLLQTATGATRYIYTESGEIGNYLKDFYDRRWTPENPDASGPRTYNRTANYWTATQNTNFLYKTDYVRLKNLEIGYNLPAKINKKLGIDNLRIYVSGYNLFTYSPDIKDFDPESPYYGLYGQPYPIQRVINLGLILKF